MARVQLDKELESLNEQILRLGALVDEALEKSLAALETGDLAASGMVIEGDTIIDSLRAACSPPRSPSRATLSVWVTARLASRKSSCAWLPCAAMARVTT